MDDEWRFQTSLWRSSSEDHQVLADVKLPSHGIDSSRYNLDFDPRLNGPQQACDSSLWEEKCRTNTRTETLDASEGSDLFYVTKKQELTDTISRRMFTRKQTVGSLSGRDILSGSQAECYFWHPDPYNLSLAHIFPGLLLYLLSHG